MTANLPQLRGSERADFKTCQQKWWWGWRYGYRQAGEQANALWFGSGIHLALAHYYQPQGRGRLAGFKRGPHPAETWDHWAKGERHRFFPKNGPGQVPEDKFVDMVALGHAMLVHYIQHYGSDESWEFLAPEIPFSVIIPDYDGKMLLNYVGTLDGAYRDHAELHPVPKIIEHKSAASISTLYLTLADQPNGYSLAADVALRDAKVIGDDERISWITYNFLRKAMPDDRPTNESGHYLNKDGTVSKRQPPEYFKRHAEVRSPKDHQMTLRHMINESKQMQLIRDGVLEPTKNPGFLNENCKRCPFAEMCELHEHGEDWEEFAETFLVQRDPYADHRPGVKPGKTSKFMGDY